VNLPKAASLGEEAFHDCTSLTAADFPKAVDLGLSAFDSCTALTTVNFPAVPAVGNFCFWGCTALAAVNLPAAASIGFISFYNTGARALTITLGRNAPALSSASAANVHDYARTVIIRRPRTVPAAMPAGRSFSSISFAWRTGESLSPCGFRICNGRDNE
jgi:hypothetical protein